MDKLTTKLDDKLFAPKPPTTSKQDNHHVSRVLPGLTTVWRKEKEIRKLRKQKTQERIKNERKSAEK